MIYDSTDLRRMVFGEDFKESVNIEIENIILNDIRYTINNTRYIE
jgi:hypothetical protein